MRYSHPGDADFGAPAASTSVPCACPYRPGLRTRAVPLLERLPDFALDAADEAANVAWLFHGTSRTAAKAITYGDFDRALAGARSGDDEIRRRGYEGGPHRLRHLGDLSRRISDDEKLRGEARRACGAYDLGEYLGGFTSSAWAYVTADSATMRNLLNVSTRWRRSTS